MKSSDWECKQQGWVRTEGLDQGSRLKGQQQRESNPQSRAVRCGAFCRCARWPAQTSSRPTSWRPSGSAPPPGTAKLGRHAWGAPAGIKGWERKELTMQEMNEKEGATISRDTKREVNTDTARLNSMNFPIRCSHFILHNIQRSGLPNPIWAV